MTRCRMARFTFGLFLMAAVLTACAAFQPQVVSHVARFTDFERDPAGAAFAVVPLAHQKNSAEYNQYRREIEARLVDLGMVRAAAQAQADYLVTFDYSTGSRQESRVVEEYGEVVPSQTITTSELVYNSVTGMYEHQPRTEYIPSVTGVTGYRTVTETVYDRAFYFSMFDLARSRGDDLYPAYEGTVTSSGATPSFAAVSACLFDALFTNFLQPGTQDLTQPSNTCLR